MKHWIFPLVFGFALTSHAELTNDQRVETSPNNIRNMVYRLKLFPKKFMGRWYFNREEIDQLIMAGG